MFVVWLGLTSCLIVVSMTIGSTSASGEPAPSALTLGLSPTSGPTPVLAPAGPPVDVDLSAEPAGPAFPEQVARSVNYAGLAWSIIDARLVPKADNTTGRPIVVVEAMVSNTTAETVLRVRDSDLALVWPDGRRSEVSRFEQVSGRRAFTLEPGASGPVTLVFKLNVVRDPQISSLTLEFGESGRIPAVLPLVGPGDPLPFPIAGQIDRSSTLVEDQGLPEVELIISPTAVSLDIDAGPYRAAIGQRLVVVEVTVQWSASSVDTAHLRKTFWQLQTDGQPIRASRVIRGDSPTVNEDQLRLLFVVDEAEVGTALTVAADTAQSADHVISFLPR